MASIRSKYHLKRRIATDSSEMSTIKPIDSKGIPHQLASQNRDAIVIKVDVFKVFFLIRSKKSSKDRNYLEFIVMSTRVLEQNGGMKMGNSGVTFLVWFLRS